MEQSLPGNKYNMVAGLVFWDQGLLLCPLDQTLVVCIIKR